MNGLKNVQSRWNDSLSRVGWADLESLLADYYRGQGYQVEHVGTGASGADFDGGIDLKLRKDDQYIVVQCKHWNVKQVTHNAMHELFGVMLTQGATGAILVTSGEFTASAKQAAATQNRLQLIDGNALRDMLGPLPEPIGAGPDDPRGAQSPDAIMQALLAQSLLNGSYRKQRSPYAFYLIALAFLVLIVFIWLLMRNAVDRVNDELAKPSPAEIARIAASYMQQAATEKPTAPAMPAATSPSPAATPAPVAKASITISPPMSEQELREWKKKNANSMKVLDNSTPKL
jgi:restriction system protein